MDAEGINAVVEVYGGIYVEGIILGVRLGGGVDLNHD